MKENQFEKEPWQEHHYRTGTTNPPKSGGTLVTVLLVVVIILGGLVSALSIMNVQLFRQVKSQEKNDGQQPRFYAREQLPPIQPEAPGGVLGMSGETVSSILQRYYQLPAGVYVNQVRQGGAAHRAGLRAGDVVIAFQDRQIASIEELTTAIHATKAGDRVELLIYRDDRQMRITLIIE